MFNYSIFIFHDMFLSLYRYPLYVKKNYIDEPLLTDELRFSESDTMHSIDSMDFICYLYSLHLFLSHAVLSAASVAGAFNWRPQSLFAIETPQSYTTFLPQRPQDLRDLLITHPLLQHSGKPDYCGPVASECIRGSTGNRVVLKEWVRIEKHII